MCSLQNRRRVLDAEIAVIPVSLMGHLLDEADVGAALQHRGGHAVPEEVAGAGLLEAGGQDVLADPLREVVDVEALAGVPEEEDTVVARARQPGPRLLEVLETPGQGALTDGDDSVLPALALAHCCEARWLRAA